MATIRILLAPSHVMRNIYVQSRGEQANFVRENIGRYLILPPMELGTDLVGNSFVGWSAAQEVFDLTNDPSRQGERIERYGNGRSLSMGDVVQVGEERFAYLSRGWTQL